MKIFKPLQLGFNQRVLEHGGHFHFVASITMGIRLSTGEALLETEYMKDAIEHMGSKPLPDFGMPKPMAEYLVSGNFHASNQQAVEAGEIAVKVGEQQKRLFVFGPREWVMGLPSKPEPITQLPIEYGHAFGGNGLASNPDGMGYNDTRLPAIELPERLVDSANKAFPPAGLGVLDPSWQQRLRFQGTYDDSYLAKYFPGYPPDMDWRMFMASPDDQWQQAYYTGDEAFEIHNMHPEKTLISGQLPGLFARCFIDQPAASGELHLTELVPNLDTIWLFPEADLALLIWRAGLIVNDDEAEQVDGVLIAYESRLDSKRDHAHYHQAYARRKHSDDVLLNNFNTLDLIPNGHRCAMQILQADALADTDQVAWADNLEAKIEHSQQLIKQKQAELEAELANSAPGNQNTPHSPEMEQLQNLLKQGNAAPIEDPDVLELKQKMEALLPGITSGDPAKMDLTQFSFDKIEKLVQLTQQLTQKKADMAQAESEKMLQQLQQEADAALAQAAENSGQSDFDLEQSLQQTKDLLNREREQTPPLPRMNADEIADKLREFNPDTTAAMQNLQNLKATGADPEQIQQMEDMIRASLDNDQAQLADGLKQAESAFRQSYMLGAHFMDMGASPHSVSLEQRREHFLQLHARYQPLTGQDWACLDLSNLQLDGIDLSDCYLEQIDFTGSSLRNAKFNGAILARAIFNQADVSGARFDQTNLGAIQARKANFSHTQITGAKLSRADLSFADFTGARLEEIESLELKLNHAIFTQATLPSLRLIDLELEGTSFAQATLTQSAFLQSSFSKIDFSGADLSGTTWADVALDLVNFDGANLSKNCFVATEAEKTRVSQSRFEAAILDRANFQGIQMPGTHLKSAVLDNAIFNGANLKNSNLCDAQAKQTQFRKADLRNCDCRGINLMEGSMAKAHLSGCDLSDANLFAVDFLRAHVGETRFNGSYLENTLIQDWRPA